MKLSRAYTSGAKAVDQYGGTCAEIHFDDGRVVQVSGSEDGRVLLRMWEPGGTMEYGFTDSGGSPSNTMPVLSMVVRLTDVAVIEDMYVRGTRYVKGGE